MPRALADQFHWVSMSEVVLDPGRTLEAHADQPTTGFPGPVGFRRRLAARKDLANLRIAIATKWAG